MHGRSPPYDAYSGATRSHTPSMGHGDARHPVRPHSRSPPADQRGYSHSSRGGSSTHFHPEQSGQSGQEQRAFYQDRSGTLGHNHRHEGDRSLHESVSSQRAPLPSGPPPASSFRDHAPSATLVLRSLAPTVNDEMILHALGSFRPLFVRTMHDKATGESRGFAFVNFDSVESAMDVTRAFASKPFVLEHRQVSIGYGDSNRRRSPGSEASRSRGGDRVWSPRRSNSHREELPDQRAPARDWICDECNVTNFARRTACFQCNAPKTADTKEVPPSVAFQVQRSSSNDGAFSGGVDDTSPPLPYANESREGVDHTVSDENTWDTPSRVLMVRMLPPDIEEGELHVVFAEFDGVQDIRLIRDRTTNAPRGFAFIEFRDVESASETLGKCSDLHVGGCRVQVSYARDALQTRPYYSADSLQGGPHTGNSMTATALEQAQRSLARGYGADSTPDDQQNDMAADVTALLDNAAAEVMPHFEEPKKRWPLPFETAGGSYVYANESGLYWDPDSMFYYNAQTKLYYSHFTGTYYRCLSAGDGSAATFETFTPPLPIDNAVYGGLTVNRPTANASGLSLSLKKEKKKAPGISFGLKSAVFGSASSVFEQKQPARATSGSVAAPFGTGAGAASVGMKRKSAEDIAKWSQRQREIKTGEKATATAAEQQRSSQIGAKAGASLAGKGTGAASSAASAVIDALTNAAQQAPICLLCRRKFGSLELLHKHEKLSKLHQQNVAKAKENKQHIAAQYREQEEELTRDLKKLRQQERTMPSPAAVGWDSSSKASSEPAVGSLEAGIGGKMLKMMGWKSGEGLGKHGTGITAPIKAAGSAGRAETAGLGSKASLSASVDLSDATTDKERRQRLARARYEASETSR